MDIYLEKSLSKVIRENSCGKQRTVLTLIVLDSIVNFSDSISSFILSRKQTRIHEINLVCII